jgi:tyrosinase
MNVMPENLPKDDFVNLYWTAKRAETWNLVDSVGGEGVLLFLCVLWGRKE